jgi:hypothetical protein
MVSRAGLEPATHQLNAHCDEIIDQLVALDPDHLVGHGIYARIVYD